MEEDKSGYPSDDLDASFAALGSNDAILEAAVDFVAEASFLVARTGDNRIAHFPASQTRIKTVF